MTTPHTPGRLHVAGQDKVQIRSDKHQIAKAWCFAGKTGQANARRLVAAWNYAEMLGMSTEELELAEHPIHSRRKLEAQRDELLETLNEVLPALHGRFNARVREALAKAEGGAAWPRVDAAIANHQPTAG